MPPSGWRQEAHGGISYSTAGTPRRRLTCRRPMIPALRTEGASVVIRYKPNAARTATAPQSRAWSETRAAVPRDGLGVHQAELEKYMSSGVPACKGKRLRPGDRRHGVGATSRTSPIFLSQTLWSGHARSRAAPEREARSTTSSQRIRARLGFIVDGGLATRGQSRDSRRTCPAERTSGSAWRPIARP